MRTRRESLPRTPAFLRPTSIPRRLAGRRPAPNALFEALRFGFGLFEFIEARLRPDSGHAHEPLSREHRIHAHAVAGDHIRDATSTTSGFFGIALESDPPVPHKTSQLVPRFIRQR